MSVTSVKKFMVLDRGSDLVDLREALRGGKP